MNLNQRKIEVSDDVWLMLRNKQNELTNKAGRYIQQKDITNFALKTILNDIHLESNKDGWILSAESLIYLTPDFGDAHDCVTDIISIEDAINYLKNKDNRIDGISIVYKNSIWGLTNDSYDIYYNIVLQTSEYDNSIKHLWIPNTYIDKFLKYIVDHKIVNECILEWSTKYSGEIKSNPCSDF